MIRSLTIGLPLAARSLAQIASSVKSFLRDSLPVLERANLTPRTLRFTLPAAGQEAELDGAVQSSVRWVDGLASEVGVRWICLPLDLVSPGPRTLRLATALDAVGRHQKLFLNLIVADNGKIAVNSVNDAADTILKVSQQSNNGFDNFRVGVSCNCPPNAPFFPFSRHVGDDLAFSFALETTNIALGAIKEGSEDVAQARDRIIRALVPRLRDVQSIGDEIAGTTRVEFRGMDASFAPFPDGKMSVGALVEQFIGASIGSHGSIFITALLTDALRTALKESGARSIGFNGAMYSILEDERLASANSKRTVTLDGLISLAVVCGCGIDMVPVPGASFQEEIAAVILDIAAVSSTLKKPLGVRLLPIPGQRVNEFTQFNLDFLCDSRVVGLSANDRRVVLPGHLLEFLNPLIKDS